MITVRHKLIFCLIFIFWQVGILFLQEDLYSLSGKNIDEAIESLNAEIKKATTNDEKFKSTSLLASLYENAGQYEKARSLYSLASSYVGLNTLDGQTMLLGAIRSSLSYADVSTADFLLSTGFVTFANENIQAYSKLYAVWSWLIKAQTKKERAGPISILKQYVNAQDMYSVRSVILLTLYFVTNEQIWKQQLQSQFPQSTESAILAGTVQKYPAPFWYFN